MIFEDFVGGLCKESPIGQEPVSIIRYTRPGSSIKWPTPNKFATQRNVNWLLFTPKVAKQDQKSSDAIDD